MECTIIEGGKKSIIVYTITNLERVVMFFLIVHDYLDYVDNDAVMTLHAQSP